MLFSAALIRHTFLAAVSVCAYACPVFGRKILASEQVHVFFLVCPMSLFGLQALSCFFPPAVRAQQVSALKVYVQSRPPEVTRPCYPCPKASSLSVTSASLHPNPPHRHRHRHSSLSEIPAPTHRVRNPQTRQRAPQTQELEESAKI